MIWTVFWIYTIFLMFIWWFFAVTYVHAMKFKNFSRILKTVTNLLFISLLAISIIWYIFVFQIEESKISVDSKDSSTKIEYY